MIMVYTYNIHDIPECQILIYILCSRNKLYIKYVLLHVFSQCTYINTGMYRHVKRRYISLLSVLVCSLDVVACCE